MTLWLRHPERVDMASVHCKSVLRLCLVVASPTRQTGANRQWLAKRYPPTHRQRSLGLEGTRTFCVSVVGSEAKTFIESYVELPAATDYAFPEMAWSCGRSQGPTSMPLQDAYNHGIPISRIRPNNLTTAEPPAEGLCL